MRPPTRPTAIEHEGNRIRDKVGVEYGQGKRVNLRHVIYLSPEGLSPNRRKVSPNQVPLAIFLWTAGAVLAGNAGITVILGSRRVPHLHLLGFSARRTASSACGLFGNA
jgi:hypothetical protein